MERKHRHIMVKVLKIKTKDTTFKAINEQSHITCSETKIQLKTDVLSETMEVMRQWKDIFNTLKKK
jgi:transcriptional regulator of met regulon